MPEIEIAMALGSGADQVVVIGTNGNDSIAMGLNGLSLNADGGVDVTFSVIPAALEVQGLDGVNFLTGRDGFGAGLACAGSLTLRAGNLGDELNGGNGNDVITGNVGADQIAGGSGANTTVGGPGADRRLRRRHARRVRRRGRHADPRRSGVDTAYVDPGSTPPRSRSRTSSARRLRPPAPPAPPAPAAGTCTYVAMQNAVAATVAPTYDRLADPAPVAVETHFPR